MKSTLTITALCQEASTFAAIESQHHEPSIYGVTDGKAIGTYLEHKFQFHLSSSYLYTEGSSAKGMDFPELGVDMKVTSIRQPQSSSPFKSARQKVFGLGYALLVFVYDKVDNHIDETGNLNIVHTIFVNSSRTADYQTTSGIARILDNNGNQDDLVAFFSERNLPIDDIQATALANELLTNRPTIGFLTISNALQWRLQYARVIAKAGAVNGITRIR